MTQQELDALKALADAATPDRWEIWSAATGADYIVRVPRGKNYYAVIATDCTYSNAAFIAAARAAVPALIAEVERLQVAWSAEHDAYIRADEQARMARREVERLRAELAAARNLTMDVRRADNGDVVISVE